MPPSEKPVQITTEGSLVVANDIHSFAQPAKALITHLDLNLKVDFATKKLRGTASYSLNNNNSDKLYLDTRNLVIQRVMADGQEVRYRMHEEMPYLGSALEIDITPSTKKVRVTYETRPDAPALQWLSPEQTAGKEKPFLFTQSQAILARSWVPVQDSPGIRFTYTAQVTVPADLMALMSAENPQQKNNTGVYNYSMKQPIPAYLLALAVGDLAFTPVGERTGVYAEPETLPLASSELADMEEMLTAAEALYGPYQWGRYDVLVLPPSFPFGGMENPRLTFATPTILAGDKSLVSLIAHELAHSWSGNLVTNATWNDFWLNEGFTVYFENRIMEEVYGKDVADMLALISLNDLKEEIQVMDFSEDTQLKLDLEGRDPDEGMNSIAYDKGFFFLKKIEEVVGRAEFDAFLKEYFQVHAFKTITTENFLAYLNNELLSNIPGAADRIEPDRWVYSPGLPDNAPEVESARFTQAEQQAEQFAQGALSADRLTTTGWSYHQWVQFLGSLPATTDAAQLYQLDRQFDLTKTGNNEVLFEWLKLGINADYRSSQGRLEDFLMSVGRRKFILPLYQAMVAKGGETAARAVEIYQQARPNYHYVTSHSVDALMASLPTN
jgi:leukotriene A-4 hydrolase/aminopeptidase